MLKNFEPNKYLHINRFDGSTSENDIVKISKIDPLINNECPNYTNYMDEEKNKIFGIFFTFNSY